MAARPPTHGSPPCTAVIHALIRLAKLRYGGELLPIEKCPLGAALDRLVTQCIQPNLNFEIIDEITAQMKDRGVRAALSKHGEALRAAFDAYAAVDESDGNPHAIGAADGKAGKNKGKNKGKKCGVQANQSRATAEAQQDGGVPDALHATPQIAPRGRMPC